MEQTAPIRDSGRCCPLRSRPKPTPLHDPDKLELLAQAAEVYGSSDVNQVIERLEDLLDEAGELHGWWEGPRDDPGPW